MPSGQRRELIPQGAVVAVSALVDEYEVAGQAQALPVFMGARRVPREGRRPVAAAARGHHGQFPRDAQRPQQSRGEVSVRRPAFLLLRAGIRRQQQGGRAVDQIRLAH